MSLFLGMTREPSGSQTHATDHTGFEFSWLNYDLLKGFVKRNVLPNSLQHVARCGYRSYISPTAAGLRTRAFGFSCTGRIERRSASDRRSERPEPTWLQSSVLAFAEVPSKRVRPAKRPPDRPLYHRLLTA